MGVTFRGGGSGGGTFGTDAVARASVDALKKTDFKTASQKTGVGNESILEVTRTDGTKYDLDFSWLGGSDGKMHFIARTDTSTAQPTALEAPSPTKGDTAIIRLVDGTTRYSKFDTAWVDKPMPVVNTETSIANHILRSDAVEDVAPTLIEHPAPQDKDTVIIRLSTGKLEYWTWKTALNWTKDFEGLVEASAKYNKYSDLPSPTTVLSGFIVFVLNDPNPTLNGQHIAVGSDDLLSATYWKSN